ncbi:MAG: hypothetical protein WAK40_02115 [Thermoplasmata archaeon]
MVELAEKEANPDGVATNAVQAAIAYADAYTIYLRSERSRGQDHHEVLTLIARCKAPNAGEVGSLLSRILDRKGEVEYEDRAVTMKVAIEIAKRARVLGGQVHSTVD